MLSFLKRRIVLVSIGLALVIWCVWVIDPLSNVIDSPLSQYVAVGLVLAWYGGWLLFKKLRAQRAGDQLAAAVAKPSVGERPSADVVQLRERFEEAVKALKQNKRGGHNLYELPWYVIIGAPGSGKTTALVNSGLHFPLEQRSGKGALRGVGGTRNCDWWFTDEAVFLDTAGRYTTQDSDAGADSAGWSEFLALLKKYRTRRPINGVILAVSAHDLMVQGQAGREAHVAAARRRLTELNKELRINIPVYVLVTKCDLVSGFSEYFDDVAQEGRTQVWGVTFPQEQTQSGAAAGAFAGEFDALMTRLNERVFARLEDDRDVRRRAKVFGFPQQMAALRDGLNELITDLFEATRFDQRVLLRGVYFTSGTQEGTPIDRLLGALGRRFSVPAEAVAPTGRGKAYFIERLLKDVLLAESGLAGVNRRLELRKGALQLGAYVGLVLVAVLGLVLLGWLYGRNVGYVNRVSDEVKRVQRSGGTASSASLDGIIGRLDSVYGLVRVADSRREMVPWGTGWLFAGSEFGDAARQAYAREVDDALLDRLVALFRHGMTDTSRPPSTQYGYLKGYLMLRSQEHLDVQYLTNLARREWRSAYSATPAAGDKLAEHFTRLLEYQPAGFRAPTVEQGDEALVREVRTRLQAAPLEDLIYSEIQTKYSGTEQGQSLAMLSEKVIVRKRGGRFPAAMAALYTKPIFKTVVDQDIDRLKQQFRDDYDWVWGTDRAERTFPADLEQLVVKLYEKDYIRAWNEVVDDIGLEPLTSSNVTREALVVLAGKAGKGSVLRRFLETLDQHTFLVEAAAPKTEGVLDAWRARAGAMLESLRSALKSHPPAPGLQVTEYFLPVHALLAGDAGKAPIDGLLAQLSEMAAQLEKVGGGVGQAPPTDNDLRSLGRTAEELKRDSTDLQGPANVVGGLVSDIAKSASDAVRKDAGNTLGDTFRTEVLGRCMNSINGRYPFVDATEDVRLADFADLFGTGGAYDTFFATHLKNLADTSGGSWVYRDGAPTGLPPLRQFQQAQRIREMFFGRGSRTPEVNFSISFAELTNATAVRVEIDGSTPAPRYAHDGDRSWKLKWPGDKPGAVVTFEQRGKPAQYLEARGDWALFRLLAMGPRKNQSGERFDVELVKDQARVVLRIDGMQVNSAFTGFNELRAFRCGG